MRAVHVVPLGEVAAIVALAPDAPCATAQNTVPFHATPYQKLAVGKVRVVQVVPFGDVTQRLEEIVVPWTAQNTVPFQAIELNAPLIGRVRVVHVVPSGDVITNDDDDDDTAQNTVPFQAMLDHDPEGAERAVHVVPSGDVAVAVVWLTVANRLPFHAMPRHVVLAGRVRLVHVVPSGDVTAFVEVPATAQNKPLPQVISYQKPATGRVRDVHVVPSGEVATMLVLPTLTAQKRVPFQVTLRQLAIPAGKVCAVHVVPSGDDAAILVAETATKVTALSAQEPVASFRSCSVDIFGPMDTTAICRNRASSANRYRRMARAHDTLFPSRRTD